MGFSAVEKAMIREKLNEIEITESKLEKMKEKDNSPPNKNVDAFVKKQAKIKETHEGEFFYVCALFVHCIC